MRSRALTGALLVAIVPAVLVSLLSGHAGIDSPLALYRDDPLERELARLILVELRGPRTLLALAVGASLGLCGAVLQGFTRNPLAEPGLLGVSSGAALGAVVAIYTGLGALLPLAIPVFGLLGALGASLLTLALGGGSGVLVLILAGSAVSGLMLTGVALALNLAPNPFAAYEISQWLLGSLADRGWD